MMFAECPFFRCECKRERCTAFGERIETEIQYRDSLPSGEAVGGVWPGGWVSLTGAGFEREAEKRRFKFCCALGRELPELR